MSWSSLKLSVFYVFALIFAGDTVKIGDILYKLKKPQNPELVPVKHSKRFSLFVFFSLLEIIEKSSNRIDKSSLNIYFLWICQFQMPFPRQSPNTYAG